MGGGPDSRCVGRVYGLDGAHHPNSTHDLRSGSQDHHPSTNWVDDGRMRPKHVELRKLQ